MNSVRPYAFGASWSIFANSQYATSDPRPWRNGENGAEGCSSSMFSEASPDQCPRRPGEQAELQGILGEHGLLSYTSRDPRWRHCVADGQREGFVAGGRVLKAAGIMMAVQKH